MFKAEWTEEPGRLGPQDHKESDMTERASNTPDNRTFTKER